MIRVYLKSWQGQRIKSGTLAESFHKDASPYQKILYVPVKWDDSPGVISSISKDLVEIVEEPNGQEYN